MSMPSYAPKPLKVVPDAGYQPNGIEPEPVYFPDGVPLTANDAIAALATVGTPDATDAATAVTLSNALKVRLNQVISALKATS